MIRRPPRSTLFPTRRSSDLGALALELDVRHGEEQRAARDGREVAKRGLDRHSIERRDAREASHGSDRKSTRLNSSHSQISYAVFCLKKKKIRSGGHYSRESL